MVNMHECLQFFVAGSFTIGTFILITIDKLSPEIGYPALTALIAGLGLGYVNGRKNAK